jgi:hypothetical protein
MLAEALLAQDAIKMMILGRAERGNYSTGEFIEEFCQIESKAELGAPAIPFKMWPAQKTALIDIEKNKKTIVLKARQLGLTWLVLCFIVHNALRYPGYRAIILSETEEKTKELIKRVDFILRHLPKFLICSEDEKKAFERENGKGSYKGLSFFSGVLYVQVRGQGEISEIKAQPATDGAGAGLTGDVVFFDEWALHRYAQEIFTAAYPTINRPGSGKFIGISTNRRGSYFEDVWEGAGKKGFCKVFLPWYSDPARDDDWYEGTKRTLGSKIMQEYPATEDEALLAGDNVAFPEFSEYIHVYDHAKVHIMDHWRKWGSVDNGYGDPYFWLKYAVDEDGVVYVYYEQTRWRHEPRMSYSEQARVFAGSLAYMGEDGYFKEERLDYIVAGKDAWNIGALKGDGKCFIDYYREGGLERQGFIMATTNRKLRKATCHEYFLPIKDTRGGDSETDGITGKPKYYAKVQISDECVYLIECIKRMVLDPRDPEKVGDLSDYDGGYDSLGYGLISHHLAQSKAPRDNKLSLIQRDKRRKAGKSDRKSNWR